MRAAPPLLVLLQRFGVWRGAVGGLGALTLAAIGGWWIAHGQDVGLMGSMGLALVAVVTLAAVISLGRIGACWLRWDGRCWRLGRIDAGPGGDGRVGDVRVALDLGPWMLLRFEPAEARRRPIWLPLQRHGLEVQWHALRCAVYAPRPLPADHGLQH
jgi:hypothetical protein